MTMGKNNKLKLMQPPSILRETRMLEAMKRNIEQMEEIYEEQWQSLAAKLVRVADLHVLSVKRENGKVQISLDF